MSLRTARGSPEPGRAFSLRADCAGIMLPRRDGWQVLAALRGRGDQTPAEHRSSSWVKRRVEKGRGRARVIQLPKWPCADVVLPLWSRGGAGGSTREKTLGSDRNLDGGLGHHSRNWYLAGLSGRSLSQRCIGRLSRGTGVGARRRDCI